MYDRIVLSDLMCCVKVKRPDLNVHHYGFKFKLLSMLPRGGVLRKVALNMHVMYVCQPTAIYFKECQSLSDAV